ncbi:MAG TPA: nucleoside-diphosphate sugar epimerase/dehydratase [Flavobacterium sp.]
MNLSYLPRWIILILDLSIVTFCAFFTQQLFATMGLEYVKIDHKNYVVLLFFTINIFYFWLFRTYSGIIRHSSYIDAIRIFIALFFALVTGTVFNYIYQYFFSHKLFMNSGFLINFIFSFVGLFSYRIVVKQTFEIYFVQRQTTGLIKVLIFGTGPNAIAVANSLQTEQPKRFKIIGFVDKDNQNKTKRILGLPILVLKRKIPVLLRSLSADALIIADKTLNKEEQLTLVDDCLAYNFKVYTVPLISNWEDTNEISKKVKSFEIQDLLERNPIILNNQKISEQINNKVVLITGAAGSIGSEITWQVLQFNPKLVIMLDQAETPLHNLSLQIDGKHPDSIIKAIIADVSNKKSIEEVFINHRPDIVFHAAAYKHVPLMENNPSQAVFVNVLGTKNLADLSCKYDVGRFVMVSTDKAVNPSNVMGASKRIAEKYVQSLQYKVKLQNEKIKTKFITTRFGNVLGSNGSVVPLFTEQIAKGGPITITHPEIIRYFMTIPEACQLVLEAGIMGKGGEIYIFDMGKPVKIIDLAYKMIKLAGFVPGKEIKIDIVGLRPGEKLYEELLNDTSKTLPTHHEKIMIAQEESDDFNILSVLIDDLIITCDSFTSNDIVLKMKNIVPEFISMNSIFENLDSQKANQL